MSALTLLRLGVQILAPAFQKKKKKNYNQTSRRSPKLWVWMVLFIFIFSMISWLDGTKKNRNAQSDLSSESYLNVLFVSYRATWTFCSEIYLCFSRIFKSTLKGRDFNFWALLIFQIYGMYFLSIYLYLRTDVELSFVIKGGWLGLVTWIIF